MDFTDFIRLVPKIKSADLPGEAAHALMSPPERRALLESLNLEEKKPKLSAVMMLVYPRDDKATIVLTLRNTYPGVHSAQISFPGGKYEDEDGTFLETAFRETLEEIGIPQIQMKVVREFSQIYIPPSNFLVHPFLAHSDIPLIFTPDPAEVSGIIEFSIEQLLDEASVATQRRPTSYSDAIDVKGFVIGGHYVWGATAMMLSELKEVLKKVL